MPLLVLNEGAWCGGLAMGDSYITKLLCILLSQDHAHGVGHTCELDGVRVLPVLPLIQSIACFLGLLHLQRADGDPPDALEEAVVLVFVHILQMRKLI